MSSLLALSVSVLRTVIDSSVQHSGDLTSEDESNHPQMQSQPKVDKTAMMFMIPPIGDLQTEKALEAGVRKEEG